ncbi:phage/plasmid primase, P4 family [Mycolicibacterium llatzerense]|uniref:phage/plasmid primase, P4 family n=1 Tax=Mycolicibacterium llatzerense TaxID=280871 RepID=UPI0008DD0807|nr:phage/plasmid primase, P4 family [Mycolicibacterium llatzerense]
MAHEQSLATSDTSQRSRTPVTDSEPAPLPQPLPPSLTPLTMRPRPEPVNTSPIAHLVVVNPIHLQGRRSGRADEVIPDHEPDQVPTPAPAPAPAQMSDPVAAPQAAAVPAQAVVPTPAPVRVPTPAPASAPAQVAAPVATPTPTPAEEPAETPEQAKARKEAEEARKRAERAAAAIAARGAVEKFRPLLERFGAWGLVIIRLDPGIKEPVKGVSWSKAPGLSVAEALDWLARGGNLGVDLLRSGLIDLDAENEAATKLVVSAGHVPTYRTAKSMVKGHKKFRGTHTLLWIPNGVDSTQLSSDNAMQIPLPGGGLIDVLAGKRYGVLPPTWLEEVNEQYTEAQGGGLDVDGFMPGTAGAWLFDKAAPCPPELAPLHGCLAPPTPRERIERDAESNDLTNRIDEIAWDEYIAGDHRIMLTGDVDGCGCPTAFFLGAENEKSMTLHEGCSQGYGIHIWSGTMLGELNLDSHHLSRLDFACALHGKTRSEMMKHFGLVTERELTWGVTPEDFEATAAEYEARAAAGETTAVRMPPLPASETVVYVEVGKDGLLQRAASSWAAAAGLRQHLERSVAFQSARNEAERPVMAYGAPPPRTQGASAIQPETGPDAASEEVPAAPTVQQLEGLPAVHPYMQAFQAYAAEEASKPTPLINPDNHAARYLVPMDTRSLLDAVTGPRACQAPVDIEATHAQVAEAVAAAVGGSKLRFTGDLEDWYGWDGVRWEINKAAAQLAVQALINRHRQSTDPVVQQRKLRAYVWKKPTNEIKAKYKQLGFTLDPETSALVTPQGEIVEMVPVAADKEAEAAPFQRGVISQLGACPDVICRTVEFDTDPAVLGTPGGYVVLGPGGITAMPPDPRMLISKLTAAGYDAAATAPLFEDAMRAALPDDEVRGFLQRTTGQGLFGEQEHHTLLNLRGTGGNGKGLYQDVLEAILGEYAVKLQSSVLTLAGANNHATDVLPLRGARLAFINEIPPSQLNIDLLKELTGGGTKTARGIAKDPITWKQSHTLILSSNNQLTWAPSAFRAMSRRLHEIRFEREFGTEGGPAAIHGLADRIIREEASGVLNWCLQGYLDYVARGRKLDPPAKVREWTQATLSQSSSWAAFCAEMFTVTRAKSDELTVSDVFALWSRFRAEDTDQKHVSPGSSRVVGKMLTEQLPGTVAIGRTSAKPAHVVGLRWSEEAEAIRARQSVGAPADYDRGGYPKGAVTPKDWGKPKPPPIGTVR